MTIYYTSLRRACPLHEDGPKQNDASGRATGVSISCRLLLAAVFLAAVSATPSVFLNALFLVCTGGERIEDSELIGCYFLVV